MHIYIHLLWFKLLKSSILASELIQWSDVKALKVCHLNQPCKPKPKKHKYENVNKHVTKQIGNNEPSSTLIMIDFTPKSFFLKSKIPINFSPCTAAAFMRNNFQ